MRTGNFFKRYMPIYMLSGTLLFAPLGCTAKNGYLSDKTVKSLKYDDLFEKKCFFKEPEAICKYDGHEAACDQLLIYIKEDVTKKDFDEAIALIKENNGNIVGQCLETRTIQVEIKPAEKLLYLNKILESGYVAGVTGVGFNEVINFP